MFLSQKTESPQRQAGYHYDPWLSVIASQQVWLFLWFSNSFTKRWTAYQQEETPIFLTPSQKSLLAYPPW
jgi:hypothetical protein